MKCEQYIRAILFFGTVFGGFLPAAQEPSLLPEGLEFRQVEGTARLHERTKAWRFVTHKTLSDHGLTIPTGTELTILPCGALDKIIAYAGQNDSVSVRIDAVVTQYRKSNFLFLFDATPLTGLPSPSSPDEQTSPPKEETANILRIASDPNESSVIPPDILRRMQPRQKTDFSRMEEAVEQIELVGDTILVSRTGRFIRRESGSEFVLDGFGRNISGRSFTLLPCKTLEQVEHQISQSLARQRHRVSGIVTTFRGKRFLLLQGAVRTYTHGNFTP